LSKKYIIDTSVIIDNPDMNLIKLSENGKNKLFITEVVLSELDKHKVSERHEVKWAARTFFKAIKGSSFKRRKKLELKDSSDKIYKVVLSFESEKIVIHVIVREKYLPETLKSGSRNDSKIIEVAKSYNLHCITNDTAFKVIAMSQGLEADNLYWDQIKKPEELSFLSEVSVMEDSKEDSLSDIYSSQKKWNQVHIKYQNHQDSSNTDYENGKEAFFIVNGKGLIPLDMEHESFVNKYKVPPINTDQKLYMRILESECKVIVATGSTGSGKTLMALQVGMEKVRDKNSPINGILYMRYTVNAEDKFSALGYRKGDEDTKLGYFNYPLYGSLNYIAEQTMKIENKDQDLSEAQTMQRSHITEELIEKYNIEVTDIAHARGITISNKFIIFDEIQNTPNKILQLIGTRVGKDSQIVFMGDYNQVDHPYLSKERNGLITLMKLAEKDPFVAGVKLRHTVRSDIAEWFQENVSG